MVTFCCIFLLMTHLIPCQKLSHGFKPSDYAPLGSMNSRFELQEILDSTFSRWDSLERKPDLNFARQLVPTKEQHSGATYSNSNSENYNGTIFTGKYSQSAIVSKTQEAFFKREVGTYLAESPGFQNDGVVAHHQVLYENGDDLEGKTD